MLICKKSVLLHSWEIRHLCQKQPQIFQDKIWFYLCYIIIRLKSFQNKKENKLLNFKIRWNSPHASSFPRGSLAFVTVSPFFGLITVVFAVDSCRLFQSKTAMGSLGPNIHVALCSSPASLSPASSPKSPKSRGAAKEASESTLQPPRHVESSWTRDWTSVPCNTKRSPWFLTVGT